MFWKKKKTPTETFIHESSDNRGAFRFRFGKKVSLEIEFQNKSFSIINMSATGMSFKNNKLSLDDCGVSKFSLEFTDKKPPVFLQIKMQILRIDENDICHGIFKDLSQENKEIIHKYILEKQKEKIRADKAK